MTFTKLKFEDLFVPVYLLKCIFRVIAVVEFLAVV